MHEPEKGNHESEGLRFSSYLVQTAPKIVHRISRNQLVKIKEEEAPPELQQAKCKWNGKWEVKIPFYDFLHRLKLKIRVIYSFSCNYYPFLTKFVAAVDNEVLHLKRGKANKSKKVNLTMNRAVLPRNLCSLKNRKVWAKFPAGSKLIKKWTGKQPLRSWNCSL